MKPWLYDSSHTTKALTLTLQEQNEKERRVTSGQSAGFNEGRPGGARIAPEGGKPIGFPPSGAIRAPPGRPSLKPAD